MKILESENFQFYSCDTALKLNEYFYISTFVFIFPSKINSTSKISRKYINIFYIIMNKKYTCKLFAEDLNVLSFS